jgi:hypothetical protein
MTRKKLTKSLGYHMYHVTFVKWPANMSRFSRDHPILNNFFKKNTIHNGEGEIYKKGKKSSGCFIELKKRGRNGA